jgi:hypothetical protein
VFRAEGEDAEDEDVERALEQREALVLLLGRHATRV